MKPFKRHTGRAGTLDRVNVDTDQIIPKQFLKRIERSGFGQFFDDIALSLQHEVKIREHERRRIIFQ